MKKILSLLLCVTLVFTALTVTGIIASADTVTVGDTSVWCYAGTAAGQSVDSSTIYYKADVTDAENNRYATPNEALAAAFAYINSNSASSVFLNQDITFTTPFVTNTTISNAKMNMNGFKMKYEPEALDTASYPDNAAFYLTSKTYITTGAVKDDTDTFVPYENNPFFSTTKTGTVQVVLYGNINGNVNLGKCSGILSGNNTNIYGDYITQYTGTTAIYVNNVNIYGSIVSDEAQFIQTAGSVNVTKDVIFKKGKLQNQGTLKIGGNAEFANNYRTSSNFVAIENQSNKTLSIEGNLTVHGQSADHAVFKLTNGITVGGKTVLDGVSATFAVAKSTFTKGFYNQTGAEITLDSTDKIGSEFIAEDGTSNIVLTAYGENVVSPEGTWFDSEGMAVDFASFTQGTDFNTYYAKLNPLLVSAQMLSGAEIRLSEVNGIRFLTKFDTEKINTLTEQGAIFEYGTLIAPKDKIEGENLTLDLDNSNL